MKKLFNLAEEIVEHLINKIDDIDLIYIYGGVAQGREHPKSDIEMVAVSQEKLVRWEFILDETPIFVWPYSWNQLEQIAMGKNGYWSVAGASIASAKVMWTKSPEIHALFRQIQKKAFLGSEPTLQRAIDTFDVLYGKLWRIQKAIELGMTKEITFIIWGLVKEMVNILAALNKTFLHNNWGKQIQEINAFKISPSNFSERYVTLIESEPQQALKIARNLVDEVNALLKNYILENQVCFSEDLTEIVTDWPTVLEFLNKAIIAEEQNQLPAGLFASSDNAWFNLWAFATLRECKWDIRSFFSATEAINSLPVEIATNLTTLLESKDLHKIRNATSLLAKRLRAELLAKECLLPECSSLEEACSFLKIDKL